jgi:SAM-dependent methyltransferase
MAGPPASAPSPNRLLLHVGCGPARPDKLHPFFRRPGWTELRLDIDPQVRPDIVASIVDLGCVESGSVDAVWSSHNLEHLYEHEVRKALAEFVRVLRPDGFMLCTTPDLVRVAAEIAAGRLEDTLYVSPAGPITAVDVLFGLRTSVSAGNAFMAHRTGFSAERLGRLMLEAGFHEAQTWEGNAFDLWGLGLMPLTDATLVSPARLA